jgi:hypothetical protein
MFREIRAKIVMLSVALLLIAVPMPSLIGWAAPIVRYRGYSINWSGYAIVVGGEVVTTLSGNKYWGSSQANPIYPYTVSYVYGEWTVPAIGVGTTGYIADVSVWIGIDGYDSGTVEQIGTSSEYNPSTGEIAYSAWWEVYPKFSHRISAMKVNPGDRIAAYVKFVPTGRSQKVPDRGLFVLSLTDLTTGKSFTIVQGPLEPSLYLRSSAEWVVERAAFYNPSTKQAYFAELPQFASPIVFTNCQATIVGPAVAPVHYDRMWMTAPIPSGYGYADAYGTSSTRYTIAKTNPRTGDLITGGSFSVKWVPFGAKPAVPWPGPTPE